MFLFILPGVSGLNKRVLGVQGVWVLSWFQVVGPAEQGVRVARLGSSMGSLCSSCWGLKGPPGVVHLMGVCGGMSGEILLSGGS